jgi:hypothetical protein
MWLRFTTRTVLRRKQTLVYLGAAGFIAPLWLRPLLSTARGLKRHGVTMAQLNPQRSGERDLATSGPGEILQLYVTTTKRLNP